jgi:hypothetical protein
VFYGTIAAIGGSVITPKRRERVGRRGSGLGNDASGFGDNEVGRRWGWTILGKDHKILLICGLCAPYDESVNPKVFSDVSKVLRCNRLAWKTQLRKLINRRSERRDKMRIGKIDEPLKLKDADVQHRCDRNRLIITKVLSKLGKCRRPAE